jgi:hypothetical protein
MSDNATLANGSVTLIFNASELQLVLREYCAVADTDTRELLWTATAPTKYWDTLGASLFSWTIFTTVGYGQYSPKSDRGRGLVLIAAVVGIPAFIWTASVFVAPISELVSIIVVRLKVRLPKVGVAIVWTLLCAVWIILAAAIFLTVEFTWSYARSLYFVFISSSSIGFGDTVPGTNAGNVLAFFLITGGIFIFGGWSSSVANLYSTTAWTAESVNREEGGGASPATGGDGASDGGCLQRGQDDDTRGKKQTELSTFT